MILEFNGKKPKIDSDVFLAPNVTIIGDVTIESGCSVWPGAVLRGDINSITIGKNTNIQDCTVIHVDKDNPTVIGENVTIGHSTVVHACKIENNSLIGMGATILDRAIIGKEAIVGANSLITQNKKVAERTLWGGVPGKKLRNVTSKEAEKLLESANHYASLAQEYMK
ncbi:MAG: gamma carbonic anhydrase family protein [Candidatus Zixiibacteriota bacterium]